MFFREVIGQKETAAVLRSRAREGRISHALLFSGPEGTGKLPLALAFAQYLLCDNPGADDSCGVCGGCVKNLKWSHPDLHFVFPVNTRKDVKEASSDVYLPAWREILSESPYFSLDTWYDKMGIENKQGLVHTAGAQHVLRKLSLKSFEGRYKIMLVWMAQQMNNDAANKLLKILEEPPDQTIFLLVAPSPDDLLPTVVSRTQRVQLSPLEEADITQALVAEMGLPLQQAQTFARFSSGNYVDAREHAGGDSMDQDLSRHFIDWMRSSFQGRPTLIMPWVEETAKLGREKQKAFLRYALHMVRESLNLNFGDERLKRLSPEEDEFMVKFHHHVNGLNGIQFMQIYNEAIYHIERNANPKILFLDLSLKVSRLLRLTT